LASTQNQAKSAILYLYKEVLQLQRKHAGNPSSQASN
jgi:hypothetical protein